MFIYIYIYIYIHTHTYVYIHIKIFGPKKDEVAVELRRLHNEELYDLYSSSNIIRVNRDGRGKWHVWETGEVHIGVW